MELDRAFVINGDDLRIVLAGDGGGPPLVPDPREAAEHILKAVGGPLDRHRGVITQKQLRDLLAGFWLEVNHGGSVVKGTVRDPGEVTAAVFRHLAASRAHEDGEHAPWDGDVVDTHVCCDHAPVSLASGELAVMDKVTALLRPFSQHGRRRVLRWVKNYLLDLDEPPF